MSYSYIYIRDLGLNPAQGMDIYQYFYVALKRYKQIPCPITRGS